MKTLLLVLIMCGTAFANGNACVDAASGNWNSATSWTACGGTFPGDGDTATISNGNTITITASVGTTAGLAYPGITISGSNSSSLITDGLGIYTILLGSTGTTCGTNEVGIHVEQGSAVISGATITSPSGTYPVFFEHLTFLGTGSIMTLKVSNSLIVNFGDSTGTACEGLNDGNDNGTHTVDIENNYFAGGSQTINPSTAGDDATGYPIIAHNLSFQRTGIFLYNGCNNSAGTPWSVSYNLDYLPQTTHDFFNCVFAPPDALTFTGNAEIWDATHVGLFTDSPSSGTTHTAAGITGNLVDFNPAQSGSVPAIGISIAPGSAGINYSQNMVANAYEPYQVNGGTWTGNWAVSPQTAAPNQGNYISAGNPATLIGNVSGFTGTPGTTSSNGYFCYNTSCAWTAHNNTSFQLVLASNAAYSYGLLNGDYGILPSTGVNWTDSVIVNAGSGIADYAANTWGTAGTGGVGVSNNDVYNSLTPYLTLGTSMNFISGSTAHPNAVYGDVTINPVLVDMTRSIASYDELLGGPGTDLDYFQHLAPLVTGWNINGTRTSGTLNPMWGTEYLYQYLMIGLAPTNILLANLSHSGGYIGAVPPIVIGAFA